MWQDGPLRGVRPCQPLTQGPSPRLTWQPAPLPRCPPRPGQTLCGVTQDAPFSLSLCSSPPAPPPPRLPLVPGSPVPGRLAASAWPSFPWRLPAPHTPHSPSAHPSALQGLSPDSVTCSLAHSLIRSLVLHATMTDRVPTVPGSVWCWGCIGEPNRKVPALYFAGKYVHSRGKGRVRRIALRVYKAHGHRPQGRGGLGGAREGETSVISQ